MKLFEYTDKNTAQLEAERIFSKNLNVSQHDIFMRQKECHGIIPCVRNENTNESLCVEIFIKSNMSNIWFTLHVVMYDVCFMYL